MYGGDGHSPYNSINFITSHDGFTLNDLFSYNKKHNEANREKNKDGADENYSWNCRIEGKTNDVNILNLRRQLIKNALCCLFFSLGTPMLLGGDEFMRPQKGNNNAYCQDNEISWFDWGYVKKNPNILEFYKKAIAFNKRYTILQEKKFYPAKTRMRIMCLKWHGSVKTWMGQPGMIRNPEYYVINWMGVKALPL